MNSVTNTCRADALLNRHGTSWFHVQWLSVHDNGGGNTDLTLDSMYHVRSASVIAVEITPNVTHAQGGEQRYVSSRWCQLVETCTIPCYVKREYNSQFRYHRVARKKCGTMQLLLFLVTVVQR